MIEPIPPLDEQAATLNGGSEAFRRYWQAPPPDSALARAIAFGIDPTLTFYNMFGITPAARLEQAGRMIATANDLVRLRSLRR